MGIYKKDVFFVEEPSKNYLVNNWDLNLPEFIKSLMLNDTYCGTFYTPSIKYNTFDIGNFGVIDNDEIAFVISLFNKINNNYRLEFTDGSCMTITQVYDVQGSEELVDSWWLVRFVDNDLSCQIIGIVYIMDNFCHVLGNSAYYIAPNISRVNEFSKKYWNSNGVIMLKALMLFGMYKVVDDGGDERIAIHEPSELAGYRKVISSTSPANIAYISNLFTNSDKDDVNKVNILIGKDAILQEFNEIKNANLPMISLDFDEWEIVQRFYDDNFIYQNKACNLIDVLTHQPYGNRFGFPVKDSEGKDIGIMYVIPKIDGSSVEFTCFFNSIHLFVIKIKLNHVQSLSTFELHNLEYVHSYIIVTNMKYLPTNIGGFKNINPLGNNVKEALEHLILFIPLYAMLHARPTVSSRSNRSNGRRNNSKSSSKTTTNAAVDSVIRHILKVIPNHSSNAKHESTHRSRTKDVKYVIQSWVRKGYARTYKNGKTIYVPEHVCNRRIPITEDVKLNIKM